MRAILIATGWNKNMEAILAYRPSPLLNIMGKPIAYHILEYLYKLGIRECDILLHHLPLSIRDSVGNGSRWSMNIHYHLCKDETVPFKTLNPIILGWKNETILLGTLDLLPQFDISNIHELITFPHLISTPSKEWTKWGLFPLEHLQNIPRNLAYENLPQYFKNKSKHLPGKILISVDSYHELKKSNIKSLIDNSTNIHFPTTSKQINQGVWISKGTSVNPSAKLYPPVFLGENTFVDKLAIIGPNVVIENNCIIDQNSQINNSLVCNNSYVGEALNISNSVIDRNLIVNTCLNSEVSVNEDFILSEVKPHPLMHHLANTLEKFLAITLLFLLLPIISVVWPFSKIKKKSVISIPINNLQSEGQTFDLLVWESIKGDHYPLFHKLISGIPKLINILKGELHFVGLPPRNTEEMNALPTTWKNLYLHSHAGIINLADIERAHTNNFDHIFACEMYQTVNKSPLFTLKLITRWLSTNKPLRK
jgi:NDP-sugar pyrophosphorylase family protein